jgi:hypothetical protein
MSHVYETAAVRILDWLHHAERDLTGKAVLTFNGEAGTVRAIQLDEHHGLCFTIDEPNIQGHGRRYYPVSTIKQLEPCDVKSESDIDTSD